MRYSRKWKPSASQRKEFAQRMQDPDEQATYEARQAEKARKKRSKSHYNYNTAGGNYIPTLAQYEAALKVQDMGIEGIQKDASAMVIYGYTCNEKVDHDYIHIINEFIKNEILS